jgi:hypothetical protein
MGSMKSTYNILVGRLEWKVYSTELSWRIILKYILSK